MVWLAMSWWVVLLRTVTVVVVTTTSAGVWACFEPAFEGLVASVTYDVTHRASFQVSRVTGPTCHPCRELVHH